MIDDHGYRVQIVHRFLLVPDAVFSDRLEIVSLELRPTGNSNQIERLVAIFVDPAAVETNPC